MPHSGKPANSMLLSFADILASKYGPRQRNVCQSSKFCVPVATAACTLQPAYEVACGTPVARRVICAVLTMEVGQSREQDLSVLPVALLGFPTWTSPTFSVARHRIS
jgi:hypothetical protein